MGELVVKIVEEGAGSAWRYVFKDQVSKEIHDTLTIPPNKGEIKIEALANAIRIFDPTKEKGKDTLIKILLTP